MAAQPTRKAFGRTLSDFNRLSKTERDLIAHCRIGEPLIIGTGTRPEIIRFLFLGGDVQIAFAWIKGDWNISSCSCTLSYGLHSTIHIARY